MMDPQAKKVNAILHHFHGSYMKAIEQSGLPSEKGQQLFNQLLELIQQQIKHPYHFEIFHQAVKSPFNYYQFGLDFMRPLIDFKHSHVINVEQVKRMHDQMKKGENVILLANHQTEPDPQIINLLLEPYDPVFASQMIFVAGHRVVEDPVAVPMSLGCNLLCIYSKKHVNHPPEEKEKKVLHNQRTMKKMSDLLSEGGKCIYVAPSGGRDRPNAKGEVTVAPFDAQSIEMFWLMAKKASKPTHFYPLTLLTYDLLPPPKQVEKELGERREAYFKPVQMAFGAEIDMEVFPGSDTDDRKAKRNHRAEYIWSRVRQDYLQISSNSG